VYKDSNTRTKDYLENFSKDKIIRHLVNTETPVIFDVGANVGQSVDRLKEAWPDSTVHSFEPMPEAYAVLHDTITKYSNVYCYNTALGKHNGTQSFNVSKHQPMLSSFYKLNPHSKDSIALNDPQHDHTNFLDSYVLDVNVRTLDSIAEEYNIKHIDLLKIDAQGAEEEILENGKEILKNTNIILAELMLYDLYNKQLSFYDLEKTLIPLGFKLFSIAHISQNPLNGRTDWVDIIYKREYNA
jgi:FkbM family methyltransferase